MKIPPEDFRWYAAFHDEGNHPHVHMMAWSAKPNQAYLSKDGIRQIKSTLTNQIFRQELLHVYEQKSKSRDELVVEARKAMLELAKAMREMTCIHPEAEQMIWNLSRQLGQVGGRKTYHPETGKRIIKNVLGKTQAECKAKLKKAIEESQSLDVGRADEYTVATWLRSWYEIYAKPNIRISTANRYQLMVEQYTIPRIGSIKLTKLTSRDLQKLYKDLMENGRIDRKSGHGNPGLSSTTVRSLHLMLHNAFERAIKERLILRNPTEDCIAPKVQKIEMQILPPEHIKDYLEAADRRGLLPMFYLELVTGLRKGEITALLWSDLDAKNKTISVSKQYIKNPNGELTLSRPKTETSVRKISIPQEAVDLLMAEHGKHPETPYMFPSPVTGEMYYPDSVVNLHKKILKDAGLPHIRFHDLRHTFATLALQNGVDVKTVSSMLGHYDAGFTLRTYTHATRQKQDEAAQTMGSFMAQVM